MPGDISKSSTAGNNMADIPTTYITTSRWLTASEHLVQSAHRKFQPVSPLIEEGILLVDSSSLLVLDFNTEELIRIDSVTVKKVRHGPTWKASTAHQRAERIERLRRVEPQYDNID